MLKKKVPQVLPKGSVAPLQKAVPQVTIEAPKKVAPPKPKPAPKKPASHTEQSEAVVALIKRRRQQIIVHSVIYYRMNDSIISDVTFDDWSKQLARLQEAYPQEASEAPFAEEFQGFDGSTGFHLSHIPWGLRKAQYIMQIHKERGK